MPRSVRPLKRHLPWAAPLLAAAGLGLRPSAAFAADYYVATTGSDSNPGSMAQPFATIQKGADVAVAGDTVYIHGGTYSIKTPKTTGAGVTFSKSGTSDTNRIRFWAVEGELPVFDFTNMVLSTSGYTHGFVVSGSWLHFRGLELRNVPMLMRSNNAIAVDGGGNCIFERLNLHHNSGTGIFIGKGSGGHLVLNCDSHDNYDPTSDQGAGQNADGFGVHYQTSGATTTLRGCRAWWNSDDGYDLINQEVPVIIENSWAMSNGYINSGTARPASGNGNGFKAGSSKTGVRHIIRGSLAWKNVASGFYANHSSGGNDWFNNTSYNNGTQYNLLASDPNDSSVTIILSGALAHKMRNNIGFPNKNTNMGGVDTMFNTWDLGITPANADFVSVTDTGGMGPRSADGSLPNLEFMKLPAGSKMIDKGTNVGLPFAGTAPDLGAFEYGAVTAGGASTGGSLGTTGGAVGSGGTSGGTAGGGKSTGGTSTGGTTSAGGASATGGIGASGGASGATNTGTGGASGAMSSGGTPGTGGTNGLGGATSAGASSQGGSISLGGASASGGVPATGGINGAGGSSAGSPDVPASEGCGCRVARSSSSAPFVLLPFLAAARLVRSRRRRGERR